nr:MAG TPA: CpeS-like protein [Caudoviricetes sp.]
MALSRRTERLIQDFNAFIQCFNGRWMAAVS